MFMDIYKHQNARIDATHHLTLDIAETQFI